MAGDPLGEWRPSNDETLDEWVERHEWARQQQKPGGRFDTTLYIFGAVCAVVLVVWCVVLLILEML